MTPPVEDPARPTGQAEIPAEALAHWIEPRLEPAFELNGVLEPAVLIGETPQGTRRMVPITGGTFAGAGIRGTVLGGGADWQFVRSDGVAELHALYLLQTDDGARIQVENHGLRHGPPQVMQRLAAGEPVDPSQYYFRAAPRFFAPLGRYDWLNRSLFVCSGLRSPLGIRLWIYRIG